MNNNPTDSDENLLAQAWEQWRAGEWNKLACLFSSQGVESKTYKAELALLSGAALFQIGKGIEAKEHIALAKFFGLNKELLCKVLLVGMYNNLRTAAILANLNERNSIYFDKINYYRSIVKEGNVDFLYKNKKNTELNLESYMTSVPRIIVVNGMARSGSTVLMNIIIDLLDDAHLPYAKYYIHDFDNLLKFKDHVIQNPNLHFVLKTHVVDEDLQNITKEIRSTYIYTKRDIIEVAASYVRMTRVEESPFFVKNGVSFDDVRKFLRHQIKEMQNIRKLDNCLVIDSAELSNQKLNEKVCEIAEHIGLSPSLDKVEKITLNRSRKNSAIYSNNIDLNDRTSLGHESKTFFHKKHVLEDGTSVIAELPEEWINLLEKEFLPTSF